VRELALPLLIIVNARPHSDGQYIDADSTSIPGRDAIVAASESHARPWFCAAGEFPGAFQGEETALGF